MANFFVKTVTGSMLYQPVSQSHSLHFELLIELVAQKLTELWRFKNLAYFWTWWPSSMTYLFVNVTYWNCSPIPYVDQVWWWYVKAFMSYAWQNWQTNRQTDRQTNRQTNILAKNCKFWQVTNTQAIAGDNYIHVKQRDALPPPLSLNGDLVESLLTLGYWGILIISSCHNFNGGFIITLLK